MSEKKPEDDRTSLQRRRVHNALKLLVFAGLFVGTAVFLPRPRLLKDFIPGKPAPRDLYAPVDFEVKKSPRELQAESLAVARSVAPILEYEESGRARTRAKHDSLLASLPDTGVLVLSPGATGVLRKNPRVLEEAFVLASTLSERGLVENKDSLPAPAGGEYVLIRGDEERRVSDTLIKDAQDAMTRARSFALRRFPGDSAAQEAFMGAFSYMLTPTLKYDARTTDKRRRKALSQISDVAEEFTKGQLVFARGEIVDEDGARRLEALRSLMGTSGKGRWGTIIGIFVVFMLALAFFVVYRREAPRWTIILGVSIGYALFFGSVYLARIAAGSVITPYLTLLPFLPILISIILDPEAGVFLGFLEATLLALMFGGNFSLFLYGAAMCGAGGLSSRIFRSRYQMYLMTLVLFIAGAVAATGGFLLEEATATTLLFNYLWALVSGFVSVLLVFASLPIFERVFRVSTDFLLSELASLQHPLLQELAEKAPGTFTHTVLVGNLCEAGARAIGASPLMARVGAYYHDIGKLDRPEFFVENQKGFNPHERLMPEESADILRSHVTDGERLADQHGLPKEIRRFISTHHGTSLMRFFYIKAKENDPGTPESAFRYPGPKPATPEEGICMLADASEAAVRSLDHPTEEAIRKTVDGVFAEKLADGQLSEVHFTPGQIEAVKRAFIPVLMGTFHNRITYPQA